MQVSFVSGRPASADYCREGDIYSLSLDRAASGCYLATLFAGIPAPPSVVGRQVSLADGGGNVVWTGKTDRRGQCRLPVLISGCEYTLTCDIEDNP
jgi:hypothetical protein